MREKRPVNKQTSADKILHRDRSPIAAVVAVITVIPHSEITIARHGVRLIRFRQILMAGRITAVRRSRRHYPFEAVALRFFAVDIKKWRIDPQLIARQSGQPLNIKWRSGDRIRANRRNMICPEDKNIAVMRLNKVVTAFIDKYLVARVDCASGDNFTAMAKPTGKDIKILTERIGRSVYEEILPLAYQPRKGKKEGIFFGRISKIWSSSRETTSM